MERPRYKCFNHSQCEKFLRMGRTGVFCKEIKDSGCGIGKLRPREYYTNIQSLKRRVSSEKRVLNTCLSQAENRCHFTVSGESLIRLIMIGLWHFNKSVSLKEASGE